MKRYDARLSDGTTLRVEMEYNPQTDNTAVTLRYPVGSRRWPEGHETSWFWGAFETEGVLRAGSWVERLPHDLIAEVQVRILRDWLCHLVSWIEVESDG